MLINHVIPHKICNKRPGEPSGLSRASKVTRTNNAISYHDSGRADFADEFSYNSQYQILICITCESMIQPGQRSFYSHLNKLHRITGLACKSLIERFSAFKLCSVQELAIPREKVRPVHGLAIHTAFKCNICVKTSGVPYFTLSSDKVRDHMIIHRLGISPMTAEGLGMFETCRVQTFSSAKGKIRYFEIE
jgi:hypothetical protein